MGSGISKIEGKKEKEADQTFRQAPVESSTTFSDAVDHYFFHRSTLFPARPSPDDLSGSLIDEIPAGGLSSSAAVKTFHLIPAGESSSSAAVETFHLDPVEGSSSSSSSSPSAIHFHQSTTFPARALPNALNGSANYNPFCLRPGSVTYDEATVEDASSSSSAVRFHRSTPFPARASPNALNGSANYNPLRLMQESLTYDEERTTNQHLGLDRVRDLRHGRNEEDRAITFVKKFFDFYRTGADLFFSANRETPNNGLPVSAPANPPVTFTTFLGGVLDIPSTIRPVLIFLFAGLLKFLSGGDSPSTFEFKLGITTKASESILTLGEAIFAYESEIIHVVLYLICYSLTWMLILPLHHGMVIVLGILLLCAPMLFLPNLVRKASSTGVRVALGSSFNMSLTGFTFTAAFGFFLIFGLVALLVLYFIWIFIRGRTPARGQDNEERRALWNVASLFGL